MITFCTLFSGSSGNAVYFATDQGALLVDCGMSGRQVLDALCAAGLDPAGLKALLITHEHSDHVKGVGVLEFEAQDVVRHAMVERIVRAYDADAAGKRLPADLEGSE